MNDGTGAFTDVTVTHLLVSSDHSDDVAPGDVDGDGDLDTSSATAPLARRAVSASTTAKAAHQCCRTLAGRKRPLHCAGAAFLEERGKLGVAMDTPLKEPHALTAAARADSPSREPGAS